METHVSITLNNFNLYTKETTIPIPMEISYESKKVKFNYPLSDSLKLNFSQKFIHDKVSIILSTSIESSHNKKNKTQYRSDITLNKTIFSENNQTIYEKNITMIPIEPIKEIKEMKEKKLGKILMQIQLLDPFEEWKKNFKILNKKKTGNKLKSINKQNTNDSCSKNSNINNKNNNINNMNKANKKLSDKKVQKNEDILSDIYVEPIYDQENNDNKAIDELNKLISLENINQLKEIIKKDYKKIFPNDINALKILNENLYKQYNELSVKYNEILEGLNNANENMRKKAIKYYKDYKDLKVKLEQKKNEYKNKQENIDNEISKKNKENDTIKSNLQKYYQEKDFFFKKLSSPNKEKEEENKQNIIKEKNSTKNTLSSNNEEIKMLKDALKKIASLGYNLLDGLNVTNEEKELLSAVLGDNLEKEDILKKNNGEKKNGKEEKENVGEGGDNEADKEDYDLSNQIVGLIERDVNDLYMRKLIEQVKIDQIDAITYSFEGNKKTKEVEFKIQNGNLVCNTGESFTVWLISNFSL